MVYKGNRNITGGTRTEFFPQQALNGSGNVTVTLTRAPRASTRVIAHVGNSRRAAHVTSVSGTSVTLLVVQLSATTQTNVPRGTNTVSSTTDAWRGAQTASGICVATCNNNHPATSPSTTAIVPTVAALESWSGITVVTAALAAAASETVDLAITYEPA